MNVKTRKMANGTYAYVLDGVVTPTEAVTAHGARYQGQQMARWTAGFASRSRRNYQSADVTLEG